LWSVSEIQPAALLPTSPSPAPAVHRGTQHSGRSRGVAPGDRARMDRITPAVARGELHDARRIESRPARDFAAHVNVRERSAGAHGVVQTKAAREFRVRMFHALH